MEKDEILLNTLDRWKYADDRIEYYLDTIDSWFDNMTSELEQIVLELLMRFTYFPKQYVNEVCSDIYQKIVEEWNVSLDNTVFCVLEKNDGSFSSGDQYLSDFKYENGIGSKSVYTSIAKIDGLEFIDNIVYLDDICGSGDTFINYIEKYKSYLAGKHIFYIVMCIMEGVESRLTEVCQKNDITLTVCSCICSSKAFDGEHDGNRLLFQSEAKNLQLNEKYILGYKDCEALVAFYNNTPNNTLNIFWEDNRKNKAPFPRNDNPTPKWKQLSQSKKRRERMNYDAIK